MNYSPELIEKGKAFTTQICSVLDIQNIIESVDNPLITENIKRAFGENPRANIEALKVAETFSHNHLQSEQSLNEMFGHVELKDGDLERNFSELNPNKSEDYDQ